MCAAKSKVMVGWCVGVSWVMGHAWGCKSKPALRVCMTVPFLACLRPQNMSVSAGQRDDPHVEVLAGVHQVSLRVVCRRFW